MAHTLRLTDRWPGLVAFPHRPGMSMAAPPAWRESGLALRPATAGDLDFLRRLYGETRAAELAGMAWPDTARDHFLDQQFAFQHRHYLQNFGTADFLLVVTQQDEPVGRFYVDAALPDLHIIDISLLHTWQGQGLGTALLQQAQQTAARLDRGVRLQVSAHNAGARRLYCRLGFVVEDDDGTYAGMRWP